MIVDALALSHQTRFRPGKGEYWFASILLNGIETVLVKPSTYMNNSGLAVVHATECFSVRTVEMLVLYDDFHLPLGRLRLRPSGSDGGHQGLESVIYHLQTDEIPRLRFGIGPASIPDGRDAKVDFVLQEFDAAELLQVQQQVGIAAQAAHVFVCEGIVAAMNRFNGQSDTLSPFSGTKGS